MRRTIYYWITLAIFLTPVYMNSKAHWITIWIAAILSWGAAELMYESRKLNTRK